MEYTKLTVAQLLLLGCALAQQQQLFPQDGFHQQQQLLRQPQPFQSGLQSGFQPSAFQQQQPQFQFQQPARAALQPQRQQPATASGFRPQTPQAEQFSTFGEGVETFKQINNRPAETAAQPAAAAVQTRSQFAPAPRPVVPAPVAAPTFQQQQQQPLRAAPISAPPTFQAAPTPAPAELPHALGAPAEQHDAQVFTRRPQAGVPTQTIPVQQAEALRVQQENERLQAETLRIQQENQRIKLENQRIQQENLRFRQESQKQQQQQQVPQQDTQRFHQAQHQLQEFISQQDEQPQQEVIRTAPVTPVAQPTRSRGPSRRPVAVVDTAPKVAAPVRVAPVRVPAAAPVRGDATDAVNREEEALFEEQAKNAQYSFASSVDDKLTDNSQVRQETRDGLNLAGLYSYSDGFFRRTVHYEADENGYRVVKEEVEPIGDGPQLNPNGAAEVQANISGQNFGYRITADDIKERKETEKVPVKVGLQQRQQRFQQEPEFSR